MFSGSLRRGRDPASTSRAAAAARSRGPALLSGGIEGSTCPTAAPPGCLQACSVTVARLSGWPSVG